MVRLASNFGRNGRTGNVRHLVYFLVFYGSIGIVIREFFGLRYLIRCYCLDFRRIFGTITRNFFVVGRDVLFFRRALGRDGVIFLLEGCVVRRVGNFLCRYAVQMFVSIVADVREDVMVALFARSLDRGTGRTVFVVQCVRSVGVLP